MSPETGNTTQENTHKNTHKKDLWEELSPTNEAGRHHAITSSGKILRSEEHQTIPAPQVRLPSFNTEFQDAQQNSRSKQSFSLENEREKASAALQNAIEKSKKAGYDNGYKKGERQAQQKFAELSAALQERARYAIAGLEQAKTELDERERIDIDKLSACLAEAALTIAESLVGREIDTATHIGRDAVRRGLASIPNRKDAVARLHPLDVETVGDLAGIAPGRAVKLVADPSIERGGAILEAGICTVDAQISTAIRRARATLQADDASENTDIEDPIENTNEDSENDSEDDSDNKTSGEVHENDQDENPGNRADTDDPHTLGHSTGAGEHTGEQAGPVQVTAGVRLHEPPPEQPALPEASPLLEESLQ